VIRSGSPSGDVNAECQLRAVRRCPNPSASFVRVSSAVRCFSNSCAYTASVTFAFFQRRGPIGPPCRGWFSSDLPLPLGPRLRQACDSRRPSTTSRGTASRRSGSRGSLGRAGSEPPGVLAKTSSSPTAHSFMRSATVGIPARRSRRRGHACSPLRCASICGFAATRPHRSGKHLSSRLPFGPNR
jgi:hypothetical protein